MLLGRKMIGECGSGLSSLFGTTFPVLLQEPTGTPSWLGPVLAAAVGALAAILAAILSFVAMAKASRVSVLNNARLLLDKHESLTREALSDLLALTYQARTSDADAAIVKIIARLKLLIAPREQTSQELSDHLDKIFTKPDISEWRKQLLILSWRELERLSKHEGE